MTKTLWNLALFQTPGSREPRCMHMRSTNTFSGLWPTEFLRCVDLGPSTKNLHSLHCGGNPAPQNHMEAMAENGQQSDPRVLQHLGLPNDSS